MREKIIFSWSSGKDSALALFSILQQKNFDVAGLLTTVTADYDRVSMHGVRRVLLEQQAAAIGIPLTIASISSSTDHAAYEQIITKTLLPFKEAGITTVAFGDIFLEDLKKYRETSLAKIGLKAIFPLWKQKSSILADKYLSLQFKTIITCVDSKQLSGDFCGRDFDKALIKELPKGVDPCGENGEFHTFAYGGPLFAKEIPVTRGETVVRDEQFYFCDLLPGN